MVYVKFISFVLEYSCDTSRVGVTCCRVQECNKAVCKESQLIGAEEADTSGKYICDWKSVVLCGLTFGTCDLNSHPETDELAGTIYMIVYIIHVFIQTYIKLNCGVN